jgi:hypothetical protein
MITQRSLDELDAQKRKLAGRVAALDDWLAARFAGIDYEQDPDEVLAQVDAILDDAKGMVNNARRTAVADSIEANLNLMEAQLPDE